jgi:uncharacterized protein YlxW (UPF0749 family)
MQQDTDLVGSAASLPALVSHQQLGRLHESWQERIPHDELVSPTQEKVTMVQIVKYSRIVIYFGQYCACDYILCCFFVWVSINTSAVMLQTHVMAQTDCFEDANKDRDSTWQLKIQKIEKKVKDNNNTNILVNDKSKQVQKKKNKHNTQKKKIEKNLIS